MMSKDFLPMGYVFKLKSKPDPSDFTKSGQWKGSEVVYGDFVPNSEYWHPCNGSIIKDKESPLYGMSIIANERGIYIVDKKTRKRFLSIVNRKRKKT